MFLFLPSRFLDEFGVAKIEKIFIRKQEEFLLFFSFSMSQNGAAKLIRFFDFQKVSKFIFSPFCFADYFVRTGVQK